MRLPKTWRRASKSLYFKLSLAFLLITFASAVAQVFLYRFNWNRYRLMLEQRVFWEIAESAAADLQPLLTGPIDADQVLVKLAQFANLNPKVDFYLVKGSGELYPSGQIAVTETNISIDTGPIEHFIKLKGYPEEPILGRDPYYRTTSKTQIFSAARVQIEGEPGYLYAVIGGEHYEQVQNMIGDYSLGRIGLALSAILAVLTVATGLLVFALITRRFSSMTEVVQRFSEGDYSKRIDSVSSDEIGEHARVFNQMADRLVATMEQIKQNDELRRELFANVSHELRRPISFMRAALETLLLRSADHGDEQHAVLIQQAVTSCDGLDRLVEDLFELSRLTARIKPINAEAFDLGDLVSDVVAKFKAKAEDSDIHLELDYPEELPDAFGDVGLIQRALSNLVENALHYTPTGGRVWVSIEVQEAELRISVRDSGIGMSQEELAQIFSRFYRARKARELSPSGTGLGLAITKEIVESHNSSIVVESEEGKGSTFYFNIERA